MTAIAIREPKTGGVALRTMDELERFCAAAAKSGYFRDAREMAQALVKVQYGAELGISPVSSMGGIHCIEGKLALGAGLIASRIKTSGKYDYRAKAHTADECVLVFLEAGEVVGESSFSMADARAAGVASKGPWKAYPRNMLFARAISNGARWYCAEIFNGSVYSVEEMRDVADEPAIRQPEPATPAPQQAKATEAKRKSAEKWLFTVYLPALDACVDHDALLGCIDANKEKRDRLAQVDESLLVAAKAYELRRSNGFTGLDVPLTDEDVSALANVDQIRERA